MLRSLSSGVSGLQAHQTQMDVIGNNIANVNTYGFKSSRVTFRDVYYQTLASAANASGNSGGSNPSQIGYGTTVGSIDVLNGRSGIATTGQGSDCYINGEGYFVVKDGSGNERLTQVGTFGFDGSGNLVDGKGGFVCGYPVASTSGKVSVGGAIIDFSSASNKDGKAIGESLLDGYTVEVKYGTPGTEGTTIAADSGKKTITINYTPSSSPADGSTEAILTKDELLAALTTSTNWTWKKNGGDYPSGETAPDVQYPKITVDGADTDKTTKITATTGMVAQTATYDYSQKPQKIINSFGELKSLTFSPDGTITGVDANGTVQIIGQLALANVANPSALVMEGTSYYKAVNNTGEITYGYPGSSTLGKLETGGLESSNVDLATEFANMIMTQRGFQANSKIITVSDEMLETLVNLKR